MEPGPWAARTAAAVRAELGRHRLTIAWLAPHLEMHKQSVGRRLAMPPDVPLDVEELGRIAEAIAGHTGEPVDLVAARISPF